MFTCDIREKALQQICTNTTVKSDNESQCKLVIDPIFTERICKVNFTNGDVYELNFSDGKPRPCNI